MRTTWLIILGIALVTATACSQPLPGETAPAPGPAMVGANVCARAARAQNLVPDSDFDAKPSAWSEVSGAEWNVEDAQKCPNSGSMRLEESGYARSPCFNVTAGATYSYQFMV